MQSRNIRLRFLFAVSLLSTLLAVPTTAQSTTRGSNADSVGGFHAVACTNTPAKRAGKLMAVCRNGYLPSNVITIAPNSKKLSGKTLSQLLALTWKTKGNAGTNSGTNFLGTTDKRPLELKVNKARALRLEPNATSPNVIGGFRGNVVTAGAVGAAIGGGGSPQAANRITDDHGTVSGGRINTAGNLDGDTKNAPYATVGGGNSNTASGAHATIAGGYGNSASGEDATIGGGNSNGAGAFESTVGGGLSNQTTSIYATVGGGYSNQATNTGATVGGGLFNQASGTFATIAGGFDAGASLWGQMAHAAGQFASIGDAQASELVLRNTTTDATPTELFLDGSSERLTLASGRTMSFEALVVARTDNAGGKSAGYRVTGLVENVGGTTSFVGTPAVTVLGEDNAAWGLTVQADDTNDALVFKGTGEASTAIRWVATVKTAEVLFSS